jgi:hypothetical protein
MNQKKNQTKNQTQSTHKPILCNQFEKQRLTFTELDDKKKDGKGNDKFESPQFTMFSRYNYPNNGEGQMIFQTPPITLTHHGMVKLNEKNKKYYPTDRSRAFIKVPLDLAQDGGRKLNTFLEQVDERVEELKPKIFGKKAKLYNKYVGSIREPRNEDEEEGSDAESDAESDEDSKKKSKDKKGSQGKADEPKPNFCKMKLNLTYPEGDICTLIYVRTTDENGKIKRDPVKVNSVDELIEYVRWKSTIRLLVSVSKMWAFKQKDDNGNRKFGLGYKILQIEVEPRLETNSTSEYLHNCAFVDSDAEDNSNDDDSSEENNSGSEKKKKDDLSGGEESSSSDEESDAESEPEQEESEPESEEDSSSEEEPVQTKKGKKAASPKQAAKPAAKGKATRGRQSGK